MGAKKKTVRLGNFSAVMTQFLSGTHMGSWRVKYRDGDGRECVGGVFKEEKKARARALIILEGLSHEDVGVLTLEERQIICMLREHDADLGDIADLCKSKREIEDKLTMDAVDEFISAKVDGQGYSNFQDCDYRTVLGDLKRDLGDMKMRSLKLSVLESWTNKWTVGPKRYNNKRALIVKFFKWAVTRSYCAKNEAQALSPKRVTAPEPHKVLLPAEFALLLNSCPDADLPWLALSGFAGLRAVEICGRSENRKSGLKWEDIDFENARIMLPLTAAKKTRSPKPRIIPMCPALMDWLDPWRGSSGQVHPHRRPSGGSSPVTTSLGALVGGWRNNALRASRASYRLAETKNIDLVTLEMGHTRQMLLGTYHNPRLESDAAEWFALDRASVKRAVASSGDNVVKLA